MRAHRNSSFVSAAWHCLLLLLTALWATATALHAQPYAPAPVQPAYPAAPVAPPAPVAAPASNFDDRARFLAGLEGRGPAPFRAFEQTSTWQSHSKELDSLYSYSERVRMAEMRSWATAELHPRIYRPTAIFYTFSGPDFITVDALFPEVPVYILSGLEPVGSIVAPENMTNEEIAQGLANLQRSMENIMKFSYFITKDMKVDFERTKFNGVLPILYVFLARSGKTIMDTQYCAANGNGELETSRTPIRGSGNEGVRITFTSPSGARQELYYFKTDLSNSDTGKNKAFLNFMARYGKGCSYLKSASYLLHEPSFSVTREWLLNNSATILQDDSGIPVRYFNPEKWNLTLYGNYAGVLEIFQKYYQRDLEQLYASNRSQPLTFGAGYTFKRGESALQLATLRR